MWETGEPPVRNADRAQLVDLVGQVELNPGVERQYVVPAVEAPLARNDRSQRLAGVGHQHPAPAEIGREQGRYNIGAAPRDLLDKRSLVP